MHLSRHLKRLTLASTSVAAILGGVVIASSSADLSSQINADKQTAASLRSQINAESAQISRTANGVAKAKADLAIAQARLEAQDQELSRVQNELMAARDQLLALEQKLHLASEYLAANLRADYESGKPDIVDVILNAHGFSSLLEQVNYMKDAAHKNAEILHITRVVRARVVQEAIRLGKLEARDQQLTREIEAQRNQVAVTAAALLKQQIAEESVRSGKRAHLASVNAQAVADQKKLDAIEAAAAAQARKTAEQQAVQINQQVGGTAVDTASMVQPPAGAPAAVAQMISAGNAIATLPYIWGGGHASFQAIGYDCSGSVSYVLAAAGLLSAPEVSGDFESYGDPGPGQWVTIYANPTHVWMTIAGWRFDTVALAEGGTRWSQGGGEYAGFVVRHPTGL
jgi:cell wall-associated NlpC family hydrolase